jgi:phosphatidylglycerol---prolipoprotein diacylglyceryl transferase
MTPLVLQLRILGHSFGLSVYGLFLGLAGGVGATVVALVARRVHLRVALGLCFWAATVGLLAARLGGMIVGAGDHALPLPMSYGVGLVAALVSAALYARREDLDAWLALDLLACGLAAAHAIAALGCFAAGCCYGRIAPVGVVFHQGTLAWHELAARGLVPLAAHTTPPLYPVQPIEAVALALWTVVLVLLARRPRQGRVLGLYLVGAAAVGLALLPFRAHPDVPTVTGLAAAGIALTLRPYAYRLVAALRRDPAARV